MWAGGGSCLPVRCDRLTVVHKTVPVLFRSSFQFTKCSKLVPNFYVLDRHSTHCDTQDRPVASEWFGRWRSNREGGGGGAGGWGCLAEFDLAPFPTIVYSNYLKVPTPLIQAHAVCRVVKYCLMSQTTARPSGCQPLKLLSCYFTLIASDL